MSLQWREPLWFLLAFYPLLLWLISHWKAKLNTRAYVDDALLPWVQGDQNRSYTGALKWGSSVLGWALLAAALAGPQTPLPDQYSDDSNLDVVIVLDMSESMNVRDIAPDRLQRAVLEIREWLSQSQQNRVAAVVYAGKPHLYVPFTTDADSLSFYLDRLREIQLPTSGSQAADALAFALMQLNQRIINESPAAVLWITDGDLPTNTSPQLETTLQSMRNAQIPLYILGVGTVDGDAIPNKQGQWITHEGQPVRSALNSQQLEALAEKGNGRFSAVQVDDSDWQYLDIKALEHLKNGDENRQSEEWFAIPLIPGFLLLLWSWKTSKLIKNVAPLLLLPFFYIPSPVSAEDQLEIGIKAYESEDYIAAAEAFRLAIFEANNDEQYGRALYNLANSYFQQGDFSAAQQTYTDALKYRPKHAHSLHNLKITQAIQEEIERRFRLSEQEDQNRMGREFERRVNTLDWDIHVPLTMDLDEGTENKTNPSLSPKLALPQLERLVDKGMARLKQQGANNQQQWEKRQFSLDEARIKLLQTSDRSVDVWNRLFEREEGYLAPREAPATLPGVEPW